MSAPGASHDAQTSLATSQAQPSAAHTPGPWQTRDDYTHEGRLTIIANVDGEYIDGAAHCTFDTVAVCEDEYGEALPNAAANARLIAAAPSLLAALKEALEEVAADAAALRDGCTVHSTGVVDEIALPEIARMEAVAERCRAAIAKAEGQ